VFDKEPDYGGYYLEPERTEYQIGDSFYDCIKGIIVISTLFDFVDLKHTIAHEYRHHWQFHKGWIYDGKGWNTPLEDYDYEDIIKRYFNSSVCEMDALLFSIRTAYDKTLDYWMDIMEIRKWE
jgi:hypothetical protein